MNIQKLLFEKNTRYLGLRLKVVTVAAAGILSLGISSQSIADNLVIFKDVPSAEEMGNVLFPKAESAMPKTRSIHQQPKTRSISFKNPYKEETTANAEAESIGLLIKFAYDSSDILPDSRPYLDEVGKMLNLERVAEEKILIEGHADASGDEFHNLNLSQRRAKAVKQYLVQQHHVAPQRMRVSGKGETKLLEGRDPYDPLNRRVQFYRVP